MGFSPEYMSAYPTASWGYYRGTPYYGGEGSGKGPNMAGTGSFSAGQGPSNVTGWEPSIPFLLGMVVLEMIVFSWLARHL